MDATNDDDALAYRLLGWPAAEDVLTGGSTRRWNNNAAALPPSAAADACPPPTTEYHHHHEHDDGEDWTALRLLVRTGTPDKNNGRAIFLRAMKILYANNTEPCGSNISSDETIVRWQWKIKGYFRLIQCALERPVSTTTTTSQMTSSTTHHPIIASSASSSSSSSSFSSNELSEDDWEKMAIELLKRMNVSFQQYLMELAPSDSENKSNNSNNDSTTATSLSTMMTTTIATSTSFSALISSGNEKNKYMSASSSSSSSVVLYYLQCILNIIYPYIIQHRIRLLGPTYRSVCEISESFVSILEQDKLAMEKNVRTFTSALLSPSSEAEAAAGEVVMAGWRTFSTLLHQTMEELRTIWNKFRGLLEQMTNHLLGFLDEGLERIHLSLLTTNEHGHHHLYQKNNSAMSSSASAAEKQSKIIVFLLARITSLIAMIMSGTCQFAIKDEQSVTSTTSSNSSGTADSVDGSGRSVNHLMTQFIKRLVRACHLSLLAQSSLEKQEEHDHTTNLTPHRPYLRMVEELRPRVERYFTKVICDFDSKQRIAHRVGLESFMNLSSSDVMTGLHDYSLAKLYLMKVVMKKLVVADSSMLPEPTILVHFYQSIIIDIPKCHRLFQFGCNLHRQALGILQELLIVLEHASHVLYRSSGKNELSSVMQEQKQQHYLLVSWLSPACGGNGNPMAMPNHPLTNEVVLHILQRRILSSCALDDRISQGDASHLLSLLTLLLFNQQTETYHRRNIATLLTRLLSSTSLKDLTRQSLWRSLSKACFINSAQRKRQRKPVDVDRSSLAADDVGIISWVLEALTSSRTQHIESEASYEMRQFWEEVMGNVSAVEHFTRSRDVTRATFLLSLSVGVIRSSSSLSDFFVAFDRDGTVSHNVSPRDFMERFLAFIQPILLLRRRSKNSSTSARHILLITVCIHVICALSQCDGIELPESQIDQIGSFLRDAVISASASTSVHAVGLQYCALSTVSKLGNTIRSNFGEVTLKVRYFCFCQTQINSLQTIHSHSLQHSYLLEL